MVYGMRWIQEVWKSSLAKQRARYPRISCDQSSCIVGVPYDLARITSLSIAPAHWSTLVLGRSITHSIQQETRPTQMTFPSSETDLITGLDSWTQRLTGVIQLAPEESTFPPDSLRRS
ncbi:MAG: hypothetical protein F6K11_35505 [Leptolyngbya sp. SIO3F4]|nr:hypothetical protein [Leptolyngbya sp. SIO3F4]